MRETDVFTGPRGLRLRVCTWGVDDGPPLLILHGYLEQGAAWGGVADRLLPVRPRVVAPDHRGHGLSEHVGAGGFYHFWDYVADVDAVVSWMGGGPVDLLGHSMGGTVASLYAATRPERVRRLVLVEGLGPPDGSGEHADRAVAFLDARTKPPRHGSFPDVATAAARMREFNPRISEADALFLAGRITRPVLADDPAVSRPAPGAFTWTWDALHRARSPSPFRADAHGVHLARIEAPVLLVDGADSPFRLVDRASRVARLRDVREVALPDAGHLVHHDAPDALADVVSRFLTAEHP